MKNRPIQILFIAIIQIFSPVASVISNSILYKMNPFTLFQVLWQSGDWRNLTIYFFIPLITGFSIFLMKKWSYYVLLTCTLVVTGHNLQVWWSNPGAMPLWYFSGFIVLNSLLIVYFFLPSVRAGYLNSRLRWWESKPRYLYPLPVEIKSKEKIFSGKILNISEGGIYFETPGVFAMGDQPEFNFNILNNPISIAGKVVHCRIQGSQNQFGIQFVADRKTLQTIKKIVRLLRALNVSRTREAEDRDYLNEMTTVMKDIVMNGKGLTPQIPNYRNKTSKTG